ncbi:MAG: polysaccharide deacetylase family protein [gamma proteobacterium symbiont of Bathyaustriella thionipta]|nr:polysaccharide deacetylase family protein [gamma proteobacterium symbiont of Bathyaustriella thionipta]
MNIVLSFSQVSAARYAIILQYHHVSHTTPKITSISPEQFKIHLEYLQQHNFTIWPLSKIVRYLKAGKTLPDKCVAITFDDAYRSIYSTAFPMLKEKNWPFTLFLNTDAVGKSGLNLTWDEIREMNASVAEIGNHSHTHAHLIRYQKNESLQQWRARVIHEIHNAQQVLDQQLNSENGLPPRLFAYPYGEYSIALYQIIKELGYAAVGQHSGPVTFTTPKELLPRFPMGGIYTSKTQFIEKLNTYPLPLENNEVIEPVVNLNNTVSPLLKLSIKPEFFNKEIKKQLQCYVSGQGKAVISWKDNTAFVQAQKKLSVGRNRYNCTAPVTINENGQNRNGFYWYSQLWIKRHNNGHWYRE